MPSQTAGAVAHDINNLLQVILGCCEKLQADAGLSARHRDELEHIIVAAEHATALTSQVQARDGKPRAERRVMDLRRALQRLHGLLQRIVGDTVAFEMQLPPEGTGIRMGEGDLAQVLVNLAVNAREAMPGGGRFTIATSLATDDAATRPTNDEVPRVNVIVADTGAGMSADVRERAFERFFTTKTGDGSGHGLATVQALVQQHGGTIDVHSEPGRGTRFTISLPLAGSASAVDASVPVPRAFPGEVVLVVDDEPMARDVTAAFLQGLGYRTVETGSGREALAKLLDPGQHIDLLVADVTMPDMTGIELAHRLRESGSSTPVLLISGDTADSVQADSGAAVAFLPKPFNPRGLGLAVRQVLDASPRSQFATTETPSMGPAVISGVVVDQLPVPVFMVQQECFVYVNRALAALMVLPAGELLGHSSLERVHPDDRSVFPVRPDAADAPPASTQVRVRCGDGRERSVMLTTVPIVHEGTAALLGVATDMSLQPDAITLAVRMAALGRLAGGVAHDYNNLLLVIGGHLERLQKALPPGSDLRPDVEAIAAAALRAETLTDNLLSFGRRQLLAPEVHDLGAVVEAEAVELRRSLEPAIDLRLERDASVPKIEADRARLREVLWHLVENARDAMPGGGTLTLAVDAIEVDAALQSRWAFLARGGVFVRLRVIDTGSGMDPAVAAHAFEPFFTTKGKGRGAGMGLASVYGIVKQSRGYVFAERTGERGTCMTVLLPPATSQENAVDSSRASGPPVPDAGRTRNRILLVEDDPGVREVLQDVLRGRGFDVQATSTAEEAQQQLTGQTFDLLLSDVDLPGMNGARLAALLVASQPDLKVILMSGYPDDGTIDGELAARPMFLTKPFTSGVLLDSIRKVLLDDA